MGETEEHVSGSIMLLLTNINKSEELAKSLS